MQAKWEEQVEQKKEGEAGRGKNKIIRLVLGVVEEEWVKNIERKIIETEKDKLSMGWSGGKKRCKSKYEEEWQE